MSDFSTSWEFKSTFYKGHFLKMLRAVLLVGDFVIFSTKFVTDTWNKFIFELYEFHQFIDSEALNTTEIDNSSLIKVGIYCKSNDK